MGRLLVIANRLPFSVIKRAGKFNFRSSPGGLAVGLSSLPKSYERLWIGWPGITNEKLTIHDKEQIREKLAKENCLPVFLSEKQIERYYLGFSNKTIWPLFHYFPTRTIWEDRFWITYQQVNHAFFETVAGIAEPGDCIWIHDYQLMLLPQLLREKFPGLEIGFFLHIPWPSFELFRLLPWREEILNGILGADLIGFHTYDYVRHFLSSICGKRKIIISIDRLDYTKGIIQRLEAFDLFLSENPEYKEKVTLIMVAVPSRTDVEDYQILRNRLEQLVGRINGEQGAIGYIPVWYLYRFMPFHKIAALYNVADVALVTPLRDGMNLIAKEFIASKTEGRGVLILGEMTGAASELGEALIVNAYNKVAIVQAIKDALDMPLLEQIERNRLMQERIARYDVSRWSSDFIQALSDIKKKQQELYVHKLSESTRQKLITDYSRSRKRLLLLDYDGTLVGFRGKPAQAGPDEEIMNILRNLSDNKNNKVVIISGRDKQTLEEWLSSLNVSLVAEHGAWIKPRDQEWQCMQPLETRWKDTIRPILELYSDRTPGSSVEEKDFALVWHYRRADPEFANVRGQELRGALVNLTENLDVGVFEGNKILEIKNAGVNKGRAVEYWTGNQKWDFLLAAGDDYTDEEMFRALPNGAYSIKVGLSISNARFQVDTLNEIRSLLKELARN